jgi:hypothetical protein
MLTSPITKSKKKRKKNIQGSLVSWGREKQSLKKHNPETPNYSGEQVSTKRESERKREKKIRV